MRREDAQTPRVIDRKTTIGEQGLERQVHGVHTLIATIFLIIQAPEQLERRR